MSAPTTARPRRLQLLNVVPRTSCLEEGDDPPAGRSLSLPSHGLAERAEHFPPLDAARELGPRATCRKQRHRSAHHTHARRLDCRTLHHVVVQIKCAIKIFQAKRVAPPSAPPYKSIGRSSAWMSTEGMNVRSAHRPRPTSPCGRAVDPAGKRPGERARGAPARLSSQATRVQCARGVDPAQNRLPGHRPHRMGLVDGEGEGEQAHPLDQHAGHAAHGALAANELLRTARRRAEQQREGRRSGRGTEGPAQRHPCREPLLPSRAAIISPGSECPVTHCAPC